MSDPKPRWQLNFVQEMPPKDFPEIRIARHIPSTVPKGRTMYIIAAVFVIVGNFFDIRAQLHQRSFEENRLQVRAATKATLSLYDGATYDQAIAFRKKYVEDYMAKHKDASHH